MNLFERSYMLLALAYGLADAGDFKAVGEEGKKNYQLLFSTFIKMLENDEQEALIDREKKPAIIDSLKRTIKFYEMKNPKELQQMMENMKKDDPTDFIIFPAYITKKIQDHVFGLILYRKEGHYLVAMIDKLEDTNSDRPSGVFTTILPEKLSTLSKIIFQTKFEHHKDSRCNTAKVI